MRRKISRKRTIEMKKRAPANYLIVSEGTETEPLYFEGLKKTINQKFKNRVDVLIPKIDIQGEGKNTTSLVTRVERIVNQANKKYAHVWVIFDKDDFTNEQFNSAIHQCELNGYHAGWSNPCFELWLLSHFKKINRVVSQEDVLKELEKEFKKEKLGKYAKSDEDIFQKITTEERLQKALKNCAAMKKMWEDKKYANHNPMTEVDGLIDSLKEYILYE